MKQKYSLKRDHANIKKQIKEWEIKIDEVIKHHDCLAQALDEITQEMMAINI